MFEWLKKVKKLVAPGKTSTKKIFLKPVEDASTKKISLKPREKVCKTCGKIFAATQRAQKYCSEECLKVSRRESTRLSHQKHRKLTGKIITCRICGKEFQRGRGYSKACPECLAKSKAEKGKPIEKACPTCKKIFSTIYKWQIFCSRRCEVLAHRPHHEDKPCAVCGKIFTQRNSLQKTCSQECSKTFRKRNNMISHREKRKKLGKIIKCEKCGKEFQRGRGHAKACPECREKSKAKQDATRVVKKPQEEKTCSKACDLNVHQKDTKRRREILLPASTENPSTSNPEPIEPRACLYCGKIFTPEKNSTRMCSPECGRKYRTRKYVEKTCEFCGKPFRTKSSIKRFCSSTCQQRSENGATPEDYKPRTCDGCGKVFSPHQANQRFCSTACTNKHYNRKQIVEKTCLACGKVFSTTRSYQKYCSAECKNKAFYGRSKGIGERTCLLCGAKFYSAKGSAKYCSLECSDEAELLRNRARYLKSRRHEPDISSLPTEDRECAICGKTFTAPIGSDKKFCSIFCELVNDYRELHPPKEKVEKKPAKKKTLLDWQREAQQCGMSYGIYRAQIERFGKTFEELVIK